ncbi:MAG TPA: transketolase [candidate division Zixibacteria bacterium]|nr:transketolase [candidate division Zixibacteria bacterium]HBZ01190.1 transketolase [candidate division Zixibacteria bacterium]
METRDIDSLCVNTIRCLAIDMVEKAKSGHPGLPLGAAPMAYLLYTKIMNYNPKQPGWFNRDRFILSAGHGSAMLYSILHLTGYDLPLEELKRFRQWGSKTPGHPEYGLTPGVEVTTGPLGQGFANGVGMAIAERFLAAHFNKPDFPVIDHFIYSIVSDGDLMEGVSAEAASLAGHLRLSKLVYLYDNNKITIDGSTKISFTEDVGKRFEAYGWHTEHVLDANNLEELEAAIHKAKGNGEKPSLIIVDSHIGFGSPKQDTSAAHGEPLGLDAIKKTKEKLGWPLEPDFLIPEEALTHFRQAVDRGNKQMAAWQKLMDGYKKAYPELAAKFKMVMQNELPQNWEADLPTFAPQSGPIATRDACGKVMNSIAKNFEMLIGGSADLAASTKTDLKDGGDFSPENPGGRNIRYGIREHAMGSISNGINLHGGLIPFTGTFLVFSDYMRPAIRLAALMKAHVIFIFSHDSIALGEDGPTHQPISQLISLRAIPHLTVIRPADANETCAAWRWAMKHDGPVVIATSRQKLPVLDASLYPIYTDFSKGAYIMVDAENPEIILIGTGSEVSLILEAREKLLAQNIRARVVSMPSWEIFDNQPAEYRRHVLPLEIPKLSVEAASTHGWHKYVGEHGDVIGLERFGASAPSEVVMKNLGFSVENVVEFATRLISKK